MERRSIRLIAAIVHNYAYYNRRAIVFILTVVLLVCAHNYFFRSINLTGSNIPLEFLHYQEILKTHVSFLANCTVPRLDPWDKSIIKYYKKPVPLHCKSFQNNVTVLHNGILKIMHEYRYKLKCRCRTFQHNTGISDFDVKYDNWIDIPIDGLRIAKEFVELSVQ
uniref:Glycosyltransferase family 92 protein n=2 Tax=Parascaris univalens TaxID=6257 RepID=A0A915C8Z3_PARUN